MKSLLFVLAVVLTVCTHSLFADNKTPFVEKHNIRIDNVWSRPAPVKANGVVYMHIQNIGDSDDYLLSLQTSVAGIVEIHEAKMKNGMMMMGPLDSLKIAGKSSVSLEPGGYHIMLIGLKKDLLEGDRFNVTLRFAKAGVISVDVPVMNRTVKKLKMKMNHKQMKQK